MTRNWCVLILLAFSGAAWAQSNREAWLMQNYRFTGPPKPGSATATDPVVSELHRIQGMVLEILRKAEFEEDYETALVAAAQAARNAQEIGAITERLEAAKTAKAAADETRANVPLYSIAFKDHTSESAIAYWSDGTMLHYVTRGGAHVQVRLDLVDVELSERVNRARNLEFHLPR